MLRVDCKSKRSGDAGNPDAGASHCRMRGQKNRAIQCTRCASRGGLPAGASINNVEIAFARTWFESVQYNNLLIGGGHEEDEDAGRREHFNFCVRGMLRAGESE